MKKFIKQVLLFCLPLVILLAPPVYVLKYSGENYTDIDEVIARGDKYLIGYAYNESNYKYLKWKEVTTKPRQDVLAIGSSRILQIRSNTFKGPFYNAGYTVSGINEFVPFLQSIPEDKYPRILFVNLDQWMFNGNWDPVKGVETNKAKWENAFSKFPNINTQVSVWSDLLSRKYNFFSLYRKKNKGELVKIGLNAIVNEKGFRNDGSIFYGKQITRLMKKDPAANDFNYEDTYDKIKKGQRTFAFGTDINPYALQELDRFLSFCRDKNIYVVSILPPFADKVNGYLQASGKFTYMPKVYPAIQPYVAKYGFECWDMTNLSVFGSSDSETLDGFHAGEVSYLKLLIHLCEKGSRLNDMVNIDQLKKDLAARKNNYLVYDY